jgi:hypothetical protein
VFFVAVIFEANDFSIVDVFVVAIVELVAAVIVVAEVVAIFEFFVESFVVKTS